MHVLVDLVKVHASLVAGICILSPGLLSLWIRP